MPRTTRHGIRVVGLLVVTAALAAVLGSHSPVSSPSKASSPSTAPPPIYRRHDERRRPLGEADGAVPDHTTVFDDEVTGVANLDPALLGALRRAATDAAGDGVTLDVDSVGAVVPPADGAPHFGLQCMRERADVVGGEFDAGPSPNGWTVRCRVPKAADR